MKHNDLEFEKLKKKGLGLVEKLEQLVESAFANVYKKREEAKQKQAA